MPYRDVWEKVVELLDVKPEQGLTATEAKDRLQRHGPNQLRQHATKGAWAILIDQFKSLVVVLLIGAAVLSFALGDLTEGFAVIAVIAINAAIGFFTEVKATRSMEALHKMGSVTTRVRRDGRVTDIPAADLIPGDIVVLEGGDIITADLRVIDASKLECDESALTGESVPVSKNPDPLEGDPALADRHNMLYKGTALTRGSGTAVVTATGMHTELGSISSLVAEATEETTPLEKNLNALGRKLVWIVLAVTVLICALGVMRGKEFIPMLETAIALAVASIPEGLPIVATIALSRGMLRMAQRQALVRRLTSVETLGSTSIICTDKTGTLTENKMTVTRIDLDEGAVIRKDGQWMVGDHPVDGDQGSPAAEALRIAVLCNNAAIQQTEDGSFEPVGDPLEAALLLAGREAGIDRAELVKNLPEVNEDAFDSITKRMATFHQDNGGYYVAVKGAPEAVIETCSTVLTPGGERELTSELREEWENRNEQLGRDGFRVLGLGRKRVATTDEDPYADLVLVGLLGMVDPPRGDIPATIATCHRAGIRVVMITGDQAPTALNIGQAVGILDADHTEVIHGRELKSPDGLSDAEKAHLRAAAVFARVSPRQKLDLIALHQEQGAVVAMTGDGVNDAPALKKADIGIAMGQRGTQVACEAAHVVLKDDAFATIVYAIQEGRIIFGNIRKFVVYLLSCNIAEILVIFLASLINTPLPILPLQILLLNLVTDVFPALALGVGEGDPRVMNQPPRPHDEPLLTRRHWKWVSGYGVVLGLCTLGAFLIAHSGFRMDLTESVTVCFLTLAFGQLFHVFNMRDPGAGLFNNEITRNPFVWAAFALSTAILLLAVYVPPVAAILGTAAPGLRGWTAVLPMSSAPVLVDAIVRKVRRSTVH